MSFGVFIKYLAVMASVTYLIRLIPMLLIKKQIRNSFIRSFLYYIPFSVLTVMTVPAVFFSTSSVISAAVAFAVAVILTVLGKKLITVAAFSCIAVFVTEMILNFLP